jgi:hypothetical protein
MFVSIESSVFSLLVLLLPKYTSLCGRKPPADRETVGPVGFIGKVSKSERSFH